MKFCKLIIPALFFLALGTATLQAQPDSKFKRGANPTPRHALVAAPQFKPTAPAPAQFSYVPSKLSMWLNDTEGDCVTAEGAFAKACNGIFITDATVKTWATKHGVLNGANISQVLGWMRTSGFSQDGNSYTNGAYSSVDYSTESVLQAAIAMGPLAIGIDGNALPKAAGNQMGWVAFGGTPGQFSHEDHCPGLCGYGPAKYCFDQLHVPLPAGVDPAKPCYLVFTWSTIGVVDHDWIMSTCGEAWVRNPTTIIVGTGIPNPDPPLNPPAPTPPVPVPPVPVPPTPTPDALATVNAALAKGQLKLVPVNAITMTPEQVAARAKAAEDFKKAATNIQAAVKTITDYLESSAAKVEANKEP